MIWGIFLLVIIIIFIFSASNGNDMNKKLEEQHKSKIQSVLEEYNFNVSKSFSLVPSNPYLYSSKINAIFYDDNNKNILIINVKENTFDERSKIYKEKNEDFDKTNPNKYKYEYHPILINPKDIIECGVYEDDTSITKTSRGSQLGGAIVGGVLAGGAGAIIGGLSGKKTSTGATKKIELRITIDNPMNPLVKFRFLDEVSPVKKDNAKYEKAMNEAIEWQNLITVLIHRVEKEAN